MLNHSPEHKPTKVQNGVQAPFSTKQRQYLETVKRKYPQPTIAPLLLLPRPLPEQRSWLRRLFHDASNELAVLFGLIVLVAIVLLRLSSVPFATLKNLSQGNEVLQKLEVSYFSIFALASLAFFLIRTLELILQKAKLLRSDTDKKITALHDWAFDEDTHDSPKGAKDRLIDLWNWHKPLETETGQKFTWKISTTQSVSTEHVQAQNKVLFEANQRQIQANRELATEVAKLSKEIEKLRVEKKWE